jgi:hypothetical protein
VDPATVAVCQDLQDHLDLLVDQENQASPDRPVSLALLASLQLPHVSLSLHRHANHAHRDLPAHLDLLDLPETPALLALPADQGPTLLPGNPARKDLLDLLANLDRPAPPATQAAQLKANHLFLANPVPLEIQDRKDHLDHLEKLAEMDRLDLRGRKDHPGPTDHQEPQDCPDRPDLPAHQETRARKVSVRNTAPSTAAFSSKTARDGRPSESRHDDDYCIELAEHPKLYRLSTVALTPHPLANRCSCRDFLTNSNAIVSRAIFFFLFLAPSIFSATLLSKICDLL